ncbi:MAG: Ig-like domain-containing protein [Mycobacteriaceae bacterium]
MCTSRVFAPGVFASAVVLVGASMLAGATDAAAATSCNTADLISAVQAASGGGTITLSSGCTYNLTVANNTADGETGLPVITGNVTVQGNGAAIIRSTTSGTPHFRVFDVASSGALTLNGLTLSNGIADDGSNGGGAVFNHGTLAVNGGTFTGNSNPAPVPPHGNSGGAIENSGVLTVTTSTFAGNTAMEGGGVFNQGTAAITKSTFTNNTATTYGGGAIVNAHGTTTVDGCTFVGNSGPGGGAIDNDTTIAISDSTFVNNRAGNNGGGAIVNFGTATLTTSTLSGNNAPFGSSLDNFSDLNAKPPVIATLTVSSTIVADGHGGNNCGGSPPVVDAGYNIDTGTSCGFLTARGSMNNTNPQLQALASNGGSTQTMALPVGSPALDKILGTVTGCAGTTDQRGVARPQGPACDIGAYELVVLPATATTLWATPNAAVGVAGVALFATVTPSAAVGTVSFSDNGAVIGGCAARPVVSGAANCVTTFGTAGGHTISAAYSGDGAHAASAGTLALGVASSGNPLQVVLGLLIAFIHNFHLFGF